MEWGNKTLPCTSITSSTRAYAAITSASQFVAQAGDTVTEIHVFSKGQNAAGMDSLHVGLYEFDGSGPTNRVYVDSMFWDDNGGGAAKWWSFTGLKVGLVAGSTYVQAYTGDVAYSLRYCSTGGSSRRTAANNTRMADPFDDNSESTVMVLMYSVVDTSGRGGGAVAEAILEVHSATGAKVVHGPGAVGRQSGP